MRKTECISVRCTKEQRQKILKMAESRQETVSEYILYKTLQERKRKIDSKRMEEAEIEIRNLMTLVNKNEAGIDATAEIVKGVKKLCLLYK